MAFPEATPPDGWDTYENDILSIKKLVYPVLQQVIFRNNVRSKHANTPASKTNKGNNLSTWSDIDGNLSIWSYLAYLGYIPKMFRSTLLCYISKRIPHKKGVEQGKE